MNPANHDTEYLAARLIEANHQKERIDDEIKFLKAQLLEALEPGETADIKGIPAFVVRAGARRFKPEKAAEMLPEALLTEITVTETKVDRARAKDILPPALYTLCTEASAPTVTAVKP